MTTPDFYAPRSPTAVDTIAYTRRVVEAIMRNNPLTDAEVSRGLIKWLGNYMSAGTTDPINFLWIGEFFPADTNLGGIPQRGFSLVRDDSRGGVSAIAMFDPNPGGSPGLKQVLFIRSGDDRLLMEESRDGGQRWPEYPVNMFPVGQTSATWPMTQSGSFTAMWEGRAAIIGNRIHYRVWAQNSAGATSEWRVRLDAGGVSYTSTLHVLALDDQQVFDASFDVAAVRGQTWPLYLEARRTNAAGDVRGTCIKMDCHTT